MNRFLFVAFSAVVYAPLAYFIEVFTRDEAIKALYTPAFAQLAQKLEAAPPAFHLAGNLLIGAVFAFLYATLPPAAGVGRRFLQFLFVFSPFMVFEAAGASLVSATGSDAFVVLWSFFKQGILLMTAFFAALHFVGWVFRTPFATPLPWQQELDTTDKISFVVIGGALYTGLFFAVSLIGAGELNDVFNSDFYNEMLSSSFEQADFLTALLVGFGVYFLWGAVFSYFYLTAALQAEGFARILIFSSLFALYFVGDEVSVLGAGLVVSPVALLVSFIYDLIFSFLFFGLMQRFFGLGAKKSGSAS